MGNRDNFDEDEGFFESLMQKRREAAVAMPKSMSRLLKLIVGSVVLAILGLITWSVWPDGNGQSDGDVPIVRADTSDYKVEPEDRGGMPIPNKDSTIFEAMEPSSTPEKKVESLLEDSEQPLKKEEVFVEESAPQKPIQEEKETETEIPTPEIMTEEKSEVVETKPDESVVEETPIVEKKKVDVIEALKKEAGTDKPKPTVPKGNTYIQLASVKSDADAKVKWAKLKSNYAALKPLSLRVNRADLGAKGVFYRVQAGPMSADTAASTCAKVKSAGGDCLIVK